MDNLCHTLAGAALAEAGLKGRTRFGAAALMIAANLPDVDVLAFLTDTPPVALRRGWTHGVLAQGVLPLLLTGLFIAIDRLRPSGTGPPLRPGALALLCYAGVYSHVAMDWLNTYGVRLLMPLSPRWFYGDAVFIVDPWLWLMLGAGVVAARRRGRPRIAAIALILASVYTAAMIWSSIAARRTIVEAWVAARGTAPSRIMVGPVPLNPLRKTVIVDAGEHYEQAAFRWWPTEVRFNPQAVPKNAQHPAVARALETDDDFRAVLVWSRFPYYEVTPEGPGTRVTLADLRFGARAMFRVTAVVPGS